VRSESWIARWSFLEKAGDRWWPVLGSVYALTAIKRVHGMRLVGLVRKRREERRPVLAPVAQTPQGAQRVDESGGLRRIVARDAAREAANEPAGGVAHG
jgi:hypothetical protein